MNNDNNPQVPGPAKSTVTARSAGFVGLGLMGAPMAANLLKAGWSVTAWNRSTAAVVLDAPVSGGTEGAQQGTLAIMAGGPKEHFERLRPVLDAMGTTVRRLGELGAGSLAKACNQLIVGTTTAALAEAAELAERSGMDVESLFGVLSGGLAGSRVLDFVGPRLAAKDYAPTGPAKFMHKDLSFVLESAAAAGAVVPMATAGAELYRKLKDQGLGDLDLAVVRQAIANLSDAKVAAASMTATVHETAR